MATKQNHDAIRIQDQNLVVSFFFLFLTFQLFKINKRERKKN